MTRLRNAAVLIALSAVLLTVNPSRTPAQRKKAVEPPATDPGTMKVAKGFKVELLYSVPKAEQGSWVNMCVDPKGRLIVSDQYGALYRVTPPPIGAKADDRRSRRSSRRSARRRGCCGRSTLYVVVNAHGKSGLYRVTSSKNDDTLDKVETAPRSSRAAAANTARTPSCCTPTASRSRRLRQPDEADRSSTRRRVPPVWGEDHLLPRMPDGNGFMTGVLGPGGAIYNVDPDGKNWELFSVGYRNQYDAAYNRDGDLFTYDADMEWDFNTPWYRPTRVCLVASGSEFGWRNGAGKWPPYYPDNLPAGREHRPRLADRRLLRLRREVPGEVSGRVLHLRLELRQALRRPSARRTGGSYTGELEEFVTGTPLPLTDVVDQPRRRRDVLHHRRPEDQAGLYRVTYTGKESTAPAADQPRTESEAEKLRRRFSDEMGEQVSTACRPGVGFARPPGSIRPLRRPNRTRTPGRQLWDRNGSPEPRKTRRRRLPDARARACQAPCPLHARPKDPEPTAALARPHSRQAQ